MNAQQQRAGSWRREHTLVEAMKFFVIPTLTTLQHRTLYFTYLWMPRTVAHAFFAGRVATNSAVGGTRSVPAA